MSPVDPGAQHRAEQAETPMSCRQSSPIPYSRQAMTRAVGKRNGSLEQIANLRGGIEPVRLTGDLDHSPGGRVGAAGRSRGSQMPSSAKRPEQCCQSDPAPSNLNSSRKKATLGGLASALKSSPSRATERHRASRPNDPSQPTGRRQHRRGERAAVGADDRTAVKGLEAAWRSRQTSTRGSARWRRRRRSHRSERRGRQND